MMKLNAGDKAPNFTLPDAQGKRISLKDLRGKNVILYFYPKDDTSGCTKEACSFRDNAPSMEKKNTVVLGVSMDNAESHKKFAEKYGLPFKLLADTKGKVCRAYGVYGEKQLYGRKYMGIFRTTFIIGKDGKIARVFENVKPDDHAREALESVEL